MALMQEQVDGDDEYQLSSFCKQSLEFMRLIGYVHIDRRNPLLKQCKEEDDELNEGHKSE